MGGKRNSKKPDGRRFAGIPHEVLDSEAYRLLGGYAVKLLMNLTRQYNGYNNGDLAFTWAMAQKQGWASPDTLNNAKQELLTHGLICETRKGGYPRTASLYALTWHDLDECGGKLDYGARAYAQLRGAYRQYQPPEKSPAHFSKRRRKVSDTETVPKTPGNRTYEAQKHHKRPPETVSVDSQNTPQRPPETVLLYNIPGGASLSGSGSSATEIVHPADPRVKRPCILK